MGISDLLKPIYSIDCELAGLTMALNPTSERDWMFGHNVFQTNRAILSAATTERATPPSEQFATLLDQLLINL